MAWREYYAYSFENTSISGGTGLAFTPTIVRMDMDADFEIWNRCHVATDDRIYVRMQDDSFGRYQQNLKVDLRGWSGKSSSVTGMLGTNSFLPFWLPFPYRLNAGSTVTLETSDFANSGTNSLRLTCNGCKLRRGSAPWERRWEEEVPFTYTTDVTLGAITANGTTVYTLSVNSDAHFRIDKLTATRTGGALITIKDGATDRQWMDKAVHIDNMFGSAQFPHVLPAPRFIYRGSVINIQVQDISGSGNTVQLTFHGTKLFGNLPGVDADLPAESQR